MPSIPRLAALTLLAVLTAVVPPLAQSTRGPLASTRIVGGPVVTLEVPANDLSVFAAVAGIVAASRVRFGVEGPAIDRTVPSVDFARPVERTLTLTGLTVGDALDEIARVAPHLRWSESDGMILVRMTNRDSVLDRRLRHFVLDAASPRAALEALIRQLAPERVSADGIKGFVATPPELEAQLPARTGKDVSISLDDATVLTVLTTIARENGAMTWTVSYAHAPASMETATITFRESGRLAQAIRPAPAPVAASQPGERPSPDLRRMMVTSDIVSMLTTYAERARVPIGVEKLSPLEPRPLPSSSPALDLEGLSPRDAIALIVAHDSRYTWTERNGRFLVRPKPNAAVRALLDTRFQSFVRSKEPFESTLVSFISRLGAEDSRAQPMTPARTGPVLPAGTLDAAKKQLIDVSFGRETTAREVLDAICRAAGQLSWMLRSQPAALVESYVLEITSPDGWQYARSFSLPATTTTPPPLPRAVRLPPEFDRDIARVSFYSSGPNPFLTLASTAHLPIGLELTPADSAVSTDPRMTMQARPMPPLGPGRFSDALYVLIDRAPGYELSVAGGVLNIRPASIVDQRNHFLDQPIGRFTVTGMATSRAVLLLRQQMIPGGGAGTDVPSTRLTQGAAALEQPLTLDLANPTPRDILNEIAKLNGNVSWSVGYISREAGRPARVGEEDAVVSIFAYIGSLGRGVEFARDGSMRVTWPAPPVNLSSADLSPAASAAASRAVLNLPVNDRFLETSLAGLCRALAIKCSVELVTASLRGPIVPPPPTTARYDFAGMTGADAMAKIAELMPNLIYTTDGEIHRLRARAIASATNLPLDRRVETVERRIETFSDIFRVVQGLLDPSSPQLSSTNSSELVQVGGPPPSSRDRPIALSLRNVTVRQILDEIARQHGGMSWSVRYVEANGVYPELMLMLSTESGGSGQGIRVR